MQDRETRHTHASYGMAAFYRTQGGEYNLFGSSIRHNNTIHLVISRGERHRNLNCDWYHPREQLIEVRFSPTQFVELLTNMNCGSGVPCTLETIMGERMPPCDEINKVEEIHNEFKDDLKEISADLKALQAECNSLLANPKPTKADREKLRNIVDRLISDIADHAPFVAKQFIEATDKIVNEAKAEVDAAFTGAIQRLGMKALHEAIGADHLTVPALEYHDAAIEQEQA